MRRQQLELARLRPEARDARSPEAERLGDARADSVEQLARFSGSLGGPRKITDGGEPWPQLAHFGTYFTLEPSYSSSPSQ